MQYTLPILSLLLLCTLQVAQSFLVLPNNVRPLRSAILFGTAGASGVGVSDVLVDAATIRSVESDRVLSVLSELEEKSKGKAGSSLPGASAVRGKQWEIVYSSLLKQGYMPSPVKEVVKVDYEEGLIRIDTVAGPIPLGR